MDYTRQMPDLEQLMQMWSPEMEEAFEKATFSKVLSKAILDTKCIRALTFENFCKGATADRSPQR